MVEEQTARIDQSISRLLDDVDKSHLRKLQGNMFRCAAKCCDDNSGSVTSVQRCIENCSGSLQAAHKYVQSELDHFQNRIQRCIMSCNDTIRDKMGPSATQSEVSLYTKEFESCAGKCVDSHLDLIPATLKKMKEMLQRKEFQMQNH